MLDFILILYKKTSDYHHFKCFLSTGVSTSQSLGSKKIKLKSQNKIKGYYTLRIHDCIAI